MLDNANQSMLVDDRYFRGILDRSITASIRIGERPVELGRLLFMATNGGYLPLMVNVEELVSTTLGGINDLDAVRAGYRDADDARRELADFYPNAVKPSTPMTVIRFERV